MEIPRENSNCDKDLGPSTNTNSNVTSGLKLQKTKKNYETDFSLSSCLNPSRTLKYSENFNFYDANASMSELYWFEVGGDEFISSVFERFPFWIKITSAC